MALSCGLSLLPGREDIGEDVLRLLEERGRALTVILPPTEPQVSRSASFLCYRRKTDIKGALRARRGQAGGRSKGSRSDESHDSHTR